MRRCVLVLGMILAACSPAPATDTSTTLPGGPGSLRGIRLEIRPIAEGFSRAVTVATRPRDDRLYLVEQEGPIWSIEAQDRRVVLDLTDLVSVDHERGVLGLAFHPSDPHRLFVSFTDTGGTSEIAEYRFPLEAATVDPASARTIIRIDQPAKQHNGGRIAFGPDGYLYLGIGDGGYPNDPFQQGQDPHTVLGTIIRIDVDGVDPYAIPPDNPFADGVTGAPAVWMWGLRNPWGFSFDEDDVWIADVGQFRREEINRVATTDAGRNFGWPHLEGTRCHRGTPEQCADTALTPPVHEYRHRDGRCAVIGGFVHRSSDPVLDGIYLFGDFCSGEIMGFRVADDSIGPRRRLATGLTGVRFIGPGPDGTILAVTATTLVELVPRVGIPQERP